jgi:translation initiation factor IF-2
MSENLNTAALKEERLSKVAKDLGVTPKEIIDFLRPKDSAKYGALTPNSKLDVEAQELCLKHFEKDKKLKEEALRQKEEKLGRTTLTADQAQHAAVQKEQEEAFNLEEIRFIRDEFLEKETPTSRVLEEEKKPQKPSDVQAKPEAPKEPQPPVSEVTAPKEPQAAPLKGPSVVGKIDLSTIPGASKPGSRKKGKKEESSEKKALPEDSQPEIIQVTDKEGAETVLSESPAEKISDSQEKTEVEPDRKEPELIRARVERLTGPKVLGTIELKEEPPRSKEKEAVKKPEKPEKPEKTVKSPAEKEGRKKRRRIKAGIGKIDLNLIGKTADSPAARSFPGRGISGPGTEPTPEDVRRRLQENLQKAQERSRFRQAEIKKKKREKIKERESEALSAEQEKILRVAEFVPASELAKMMNVDVKDVINACMELGHMVSINQRLDAELISIIAEHFGYQVEIGDVDIMDEIKEEPDDPSQLVPRPPVVTVMGHVDHGKTSLLDYIRKANVIAGEAGGITQHIGAYNVELEDGRHITFIDTPGHEAFTAMRARGAKVTDVAIIVIAADDSVMPQTVEAINHAQAAGVPIVFAFNKMDKPGANADKIREALANMNLLVEEWGGPYQSQEISAKTGMGVQQLLEKVLLQADLLELKANPNKQASGTVIEATQEKGRGFVTTLLVQNGTLKEGDILLAGPYSGRVKALFNERGQRVKVAGPSTPVRVLGLEGAPQAGDKFYVLDDEKKARELAAKKQQLIREQGFRARKHITLDEIGRRIALGDFKQINIIIKGDTDGSVEALADSLVKLSTDNILVNILHKSVGAITESDIYLASASDAILVGFNVRPTAKAKELAEKEQVDIRTYSIIYRAIDEVKSAIEGMLKPEFEEKVTANIEVREVFNISKVGKIAGCYVQDGTVSRSDKIRVIRNGIVVHTGEIASLRRFKEDVKEVKHGFECGLGIKNFNDIQVGDLLESFTEVPVTRKL